MKQIIFLIFLIPVLTYGQNRVGINTDMPQFKLDIRSIDDVLDGPDLQLATPSVNHFLRLFGGRDGDPRPFMLFSENDTFRIATSAPDFSNFTERLTILSNGNVGINQQIPARRLHLNGNALFSGGSQIFQASDTAQLTIVDENLYQLSFDGNDIQAWDPLFVELTTLFIQRAGGNLDIGNGDLIVTNTTGDVSVGGNLAVGGLAGVGDRNVVVGPGGDFKIGAGGADADWTISPSAVYNSTHKIGIGTAAPAAKLHIIGSENDLVTASLIVHTPSPPLFDNTMFLDGNEIDVTGIISNDLRLQSQSSGGITMVQGGGSVGIGQNAPPIRKLSVTGDGIPLQGDLSAVYATVSIFNTEPNFSEMVLDGNEIQTVDETLFINSKSGHDVILASGGGRVGIGTPIIPSGYRLSVAGKVIAEELRVQLQGDWPDYVFAEDYPLLSLDAMERSIQKNSHLPGIPSADEVAEQGLEIGKMQSRMMEKLEEMTLYILQLHHRIEHLEAQNRALKSSSE